MKLSTLCYLERDGKYLMLYRNKKKNDVNHGKWIGVGGKLEASEAPEEGLMREVLEETGLRLSGYRFRGIITFVYDNKEPEYIFTYTSSEFEGELSECDEGELRWVEKEKVLDLPLWEGDKPMLRRLMESDEVFSIKLCYDKNDVLTEVKEFC